MRSAPILLALAACAHGGTAMIPLRTVGRVDLARYAGTWYEIAAIPQRFQKGCVATMATYTLRPDGEVDVLNRCRKERLDGEEKSAKGRAWVVDPETNARLKVTFFWPFRGDYWIVDLDPEYRWAVVGHPDRTYGWILSRTPAMDEETYQGILGRLREQAYDTGRFVRTLQPAG
jgi:apolipoprotein D and lipocalin family protein